MDVPPDRLRRRAHNHGRRQRLCATHPTMARRGRVREPDARDLEVLAALVRSRGHRLQAEGGGGGHGAGEAEREGLTNVEEGGQRWGWTPWSERPAAGRLGGGNRERAWIACAAQLFSTHTLGPPASAPGCRASRPESPAFSLSWLLQ
jgi:hypothetical protein